jgi:hypothetical protein
MPVVPVVRIKPVVRFREFPFGTVNDPSMREFMAPEPREDQGKTLAYLRSGVIFSYTMGADLTDRFDYPNKANPIIDGSTVGGTTEMTDGEWFWFAGLIHFVEKYNVRLPDEFLRHAAAHGWRVAKEAVPAADYRYSYFEE